MHDVYILHSTVTDRYYIGSTKNVTRRLREHNAGKVKSTRSYRPYRVVYVEPMGKRTEALQRERKIKRYKGGNAFHKLLQNSSGVV